MFACCALLLCLQGYQVTNFSEDLRNGLVLGALLSAHWPGGLQHVAPQQLCSFYK